ncbi:LysM peptidoglycan-binding domain-containing protein [Streptomyces apricus]|uniref:LysM peptidoglycan-binding domain-containing protein n=1 Tax=Streptomyces apricus TaxID=1828112 RepID=A0A5B0B0B0_9ACTN|nr:LysM peptidoglycan-binding domain-containing protein [Streptomyces apricus]KAA0935643.1 LysM peptidoglycan-binding domain-containing protein [Streptomyces apricus]
MASRGKHRRPRTSTLTRGIVAAGTGGAALALPLVGATGAHAAQAAPTAATAVPQVSLVTYQVAEGDTLTKIAKSHSTGGWKKLYKANRAVIGDDPALIRPGLELTVGTKNAGAPAGTAKTAAATTASTAAPATAKTYTDDLDGWIRESLDVMAQQGIPGTYDGIHRNILRESSGNPQAMNNWDSNAVAGTPSKGLLQVIDPTFTAYHVPGTSLDPFDPVANITAACNYAADRYGSIDNVFGAY